MERDGNFDPPEEPDGFFDPPVDPATDPNAHRRHYNPNGRSWSGSIEEFVKRRKEHDGSRGR